jgi:hypothetical protein
MEGLVGPASVKKGSRALAQDRFHNLYRIFVGQCG